MKEEGGGGEEGGEGKIDVEALKVESVPVGTEQTEKAESSEEAQVERTKSLSSPVPQTSLPLTATTTSEPFSSSSTSPTTKPKLFSTSPAPNGELHHKKSVSVSHVDDKVSPFWFLPSDLTPRPVDRGVSPRDRIHKNDIPIVDLADDEVRPR